MACPACAAGGIVGGYIGGYFGIKQPKGPKERLLSGILSSTLTLTTLVALKILFNTTLCGGASQPVVKKFCRLVVVGLLLGTIYSIAINFFLANWKTPSCGRSSGECQCGNQS